MIQSWRLQDPPPRTPRLISSRTRRCCRGDPGGAPRGRPGSRARRCGSRPGARRRCCTESGPGPRRRGLRTARRRCGRSATPGGVSSRTVRRRRTVFAVRAREDARLVRVEQVHRVRPVVAAPAARHAVGAGGIGCRRRRAPGAFRQRRSARAGAQAGARGARAPCADRGRGGATARGRGAASTKSSSATGAELGALRERLERRREARRARRGARSAPSPSRRRRARGPVSVSKATQPNA